MISRISLPHTPIRRIRHNRLSLHIPQIVFEYAPQPLTPSTPLPALASVKRNGKSYLARVDKASDRTGHLFARVTFADGFSMWTNATNVEVV